MTEAGNLKSHFLHPADGLVDSFFVRFHQMRATENGADRLLETAVDFRDHVQDARMGAAHKDTEFIFIFNDQADFIAEIVPDKTFRGLFDKSFRDRFKRINAGEIRHNKDSREDLFRFFDRFPADFVFRKESFVESCGQVGIFKSVKSVFGFKEAGARVKEAAAVDGFGIIPEACRVIIMAVGEDHRVQSGKIMAQPVRVFQRFRPLTTVEQQLPAVFFYQQGKTVLYHKGFILAAQIVH